MTADKTSTEWIRFALPTGQSVTLRSTEDLALGLHIYPDDGEEMTYLLAPPRPSVQRFSIELDIVFSSRAAGSLRLQGQADDMIRRVHDLLNRGSEFSLDAEAISDGQRTHLAVPCLHAVDLGTSSVTTANGGIGVRYLEGRLMRSGDGDLCQVSLVGASREPA